MSRQIWDLRSGPVQLDHRILAGDKAGRWEQTVCRRQKAQVMYFSCSSQLREEGKITAGNETLVAVCSLVKHLANVYEQ